MLIVRAMILLHQSVVLQSKDPSGSPFIIEITDSFLLWQRPGVSRAGRAQATQKVRRTRILSTCFLLPARPVALLPRAGCCPVALLLLWQRPSRPHWAPGKSILLQ